MKGRRSQPPPGPPDKDTYCRLLKAALEPETPAAKARLAAALGALPDTAERIDIGIHADQDGEGFVNVMIHPVGPDLYVLNKAIAPRRTLFKTAMRDGKVHPPVPLVDPEEIDFDIFKAIWDVASEWTCGVWTLAAGPDHAKAGQVFFADDFDRVARPLNGPANAT